MYLKTQRLEIKPVCPESLEQLTDLLTDDVVKKTYMLPDFASREDARKLAERIRGLSEDPARYVAGIYLQGQLIGMMNETEREGDCIEMGYALLPRFHNRGYCTEAMTGVIAYLFAQGFDRVLAGAFEGNKASLRVMEKSGMTRIEKQDMIEYRGKTHRCIYCLAKKT